MKAISPIIGIMLMLIITLALVGFTYTFVSGVFTVKTSTAFSVLDAYQDTVTIRNDGTNEIKTQDIKGTVKGNPVNLLVSPSPIPPGQTATVKPLSASLPIGTHSLRLCTSSMCNTAILTIIEVLKQIITSPITIIPSVFAAGEGGILFKSSTGSDLAIITDDGRVGIGTTSPQAPLAVNVGIGPHSDVGMMPQSPKIISGGHILTSNVRDGTPIYIGGGATDEAGSYFLAFAGMGIRHGQIGPLDTSSSLSFYTTGDNFFSERMRINSAGDVGIGIASPQSLLHVNSTSANVYLQFPVNRSSLASADCDADAELGRVIIDPRSNNYFICTNVGSIQWRNVTMTPNFS